jgi:hypothetical protein
MISIKCAVVIKLLNFLLLKLEFYIRDNNQMRKKYCELNYFQLFHPVTEKYHKRKIIEVK